mmetsp:Transcript_133191/g.230969  ORF Transcript_133191/g.230969 Transcript_133191/m.230969 type:complete len:87 (+) Transcript_133191:595-855(+)
MPRPLLEEEGNGCAWRQQNVWCALSAPQGPCCSAHPSDSLTLTLTLHQSLHQELDGYALIQAPHLTLTLRQMFLAAFSPPFQVSHT